MSLTNQIKMEVVNADLPNSTSIGTTKDIYHPGFGTVKAAIVTVNQGTTAGTVQANVYSCRGFMDENGDQFSHGISMEDAVATSNTARAQSLDSIVYVTNASGSTNTARYTGSIITNGIRLTSNITSTIQLRVSVLLIGGDGVTDTKLLTQNNTSSGNSTYAFGFRPSLILAGTNNTTNWNTQTTHANTSFGWAGWHLGTDLRNRCASYNSRDGQTASTGWTQISTAYCLQKFNTSSATIAASASITSRTGTGATLNTTAAFSAYISLLAIKVADESNVYVAGSEWGAAASGVQADDWSQVPIATKRYIGGQIAAVDGCLTKGTIYSTNLCSLNMINFDDQEYHNWAISDRDAQTTMVCKQVRDNNYMPTKDDLITLNFPGTTSTAISSDGRGQYWEMLSSPWRVRHNIHWALAMDCPMMIGGKGIGAVYLGGVDNNKRVRKLAKGPDPFGAFEEIT